MLKEIQLGLRHPINTHPSSLLTHGLKPNKWTLNQARKPIIQNKQLKLLFYLYIQLEDKLVSQIQRGPLGNFGTNQQRFARSQLHEDPPGPGQYDHERPWTQEVAPLCFFKSKTKRDPFVVDTKKDIFPPPGAYVVENYTIEKKTRVEMEEDIDLAIKKPAFNSSVTRFAQEKPKSQ